jgi:hypothetical protein
VGNETFIAFNFNPYGVVGNETFIAINIQPLRGCEEIIK